MKKIPLRRCIVTREQLPKQELLRIVRDKEGKVSVDQTGKLGGRGAYIKKDIEVLNTAKSKNILSRALEVSIPVSVGVSPSPLISVDTLGAGVMLLPGTSALLFFFLEDVQAV